MNNSVIQFKLLGIGYSENPTPLREFTVGEVTVLKDDPLSVDFTMVPEPPTATNTLGDVSTVKEVISKVLLTFPAESVTVIVQSEYVPSPKETKVMVLYPEIAEVVLEEQEPPYVIVPASSEENV